MSDAGQKIIAGLKDAVAGNFARVTIDGQTWVRLGGPALAGHRDQVIEECAKVVENYPALRSVHLVLKDVAAAIRALSTAERKP